MNSVIKVFENNQFGDIRTVEKENQIWFVGKDVARALGYADMFGALKKHVDNEDKTTMPIQQSGSNYKTTATIINESGLYSLVLSSKLPSAKQFKRWVTSEVLPQLRKRGIYSNKPMSQLEIMQQSVNILLEQEKQLKEHDERIKIIENKIENIKNLESVNKSNWRRHLDIVIKRIAKNYPILDGDNAYELVWHEFYNRVDAEGHCDLNKRLRNRKMSALKNGATKTKIKTINKLNVILEEERLINVAIVVLKKMAMQYSVTVI